MGKLHDMRRSPTLVKMIRSLTININNSIRVCVQTHVHGHICINQILSVI